uniref:Urea transporter n=1 Tax=Candidatus Kentrum sp. FW TaxID=2126338 RepID=A0A450TKN6_9GAMM|nr:MAG: Urea transporter [Candidatus Kentron sp. FW]
MNTYLKGFFHSYSEIFFLQSPMAGLLFFLVTLINPNVGIAGIVSVLAAYLFARLIGMGEAFLSSGFFTYNALLVGLAIGYFFVLNAASLFFIVVAGIFAFVISVMVNSILFYYFRLPVLSLPFAIVSPIVYLASHGYGNLRPAGPPYSHEILSLSLPFWLDSFFVSLGSILFSPNALAGMLFALAILLASRILFFLAVMGFTVGAVISGLMANVMGSGFSHVGNFNFILIAMALGGVFLVPGPKSYLIATIAVAGSTILLDSIHLFWVSHGIPVFTIPFNSVTLTFLYVLGLVGFPMVVRRVRSTPEETLDDHLANVRRFRNCPRKLALPFSGKWTVWQGFDGPWTHQGIRRYAYDFVMEKNGKTHKNQGFFPDDYHAFRKPVFSPCRGRVITVISNLPDNAPGVVDETNPWGNFIIIDTTLGHFVELSHFALGSIRVQEGQWIEAGTQLGLCGNSGYSPQPHIHVQVQEAAWAGTATVPFCFCGYLEESNAVFDDCPPEKATVEAIPVDQILASRMGFILERQFTFRARQGERRPETVTWNVGMADNGETYLDSGKGRLFFNKDQCSFYFYRLEGDDPWLSLLFTALPRMPLMYRRGMDWQDTPPVFAVGRGWRKHLANLAMAFHHGITKIEYTSAWESEGVITGTVRGRFFGKPLPIHVVLDPQSGFSRIRVGDRWLEYSDLRAKR